MRFRGDDGHGHGPGSRQSVLGIRVNIVVVGGLLLLEWVLLVAYFRAQAAVTPPASLVRVADERAASLLSPSALPPSGGAAVGWFVPASNDVGPLATKAGCPHWELMETADPKVWGPAAWWTLHAMAANYPPRPDSGHREACEQFLWGLPYMLPCGECGFHLLRRLRTTSLAQNPQAAPAQLGPGPHVPELACASRDELVRTLATIHNGVNMHNGKRAWTLPEVNQFYARAPICVRNNATWSSPSSL